MGLEQRIIKPNKFIKRFMCEEVTTAQLFTAGNQPHPDGLLSPRIFGETPAEKRVRRGFIRLPMPMIHPAVYRGFFKRRMRYIDDIIAATKKFSITKDGDLIPDENGGTGLKWFYDNFDSIKAKASIEAEDDRILSRKVKLTYNRMTREDVFIDRVVVCPLILRDINREGNMTKVDELNSIYQSIIQLSQIYKNDSSNMLIDRNMIIYKLQIKIVQMLTYAYDKIFGKDGVQRKKSMGRNPDYTSRNIISATAFSGKFGSSPIDIDRVGYPLSAVVGSFTPMFIYNLNMFFKNCFDTGKIKGITADEFESYYDNKFAKSLIDKYIKSWSERLTHISASADKDKSVIEMVYTVDGKGTFTRPITLIEIFYTIAYITVEHADRVTAITRYPILNKYNCVITKIHVLSTRETINVDIDGVNYPYYPNIFDAEDRLKTKDPAKYEELIGRLFHETIKMSNVYLKGLNADFDGDKVNNKSIFSEEATAEALSKMEQLSTVFTLDDIMKTVSGEPQQTLYSLSIEPRKDAKKVDRDTVQRILSKGNDDFDPTFIFKDIGLGRTTKKPPKYRHYDIVLLSKGDYPGIKETTKTTLGRLLINKVIFSHARLDYINVEFKGDVTNGIFNSLRDFIIAKKLTMVEFKRTMQVFEDFGFRMAAFIAPSVDADILRSNPVIDKRKAELMEKYKDKLAANDLATAIDMENELIELAKKEYKDQDYLEWYKSGSSSKMGYHNDFKVSQLMLGPIPKGLGTGEFHVSTSTFVKGIQKDEIHIMADQAVVALHAKSQNTAVPGYAAKQGTAMFQTMYLDKYGTDCKTKTGVDIFVTNKIASQLIGMTLVDGTKITPENIRKFINKSIYVRNPYMCKGSDVCSVCAGDLPYQLNGTTDRIPIGLELHTIYTELTQASLQKTHKMTAELEPIGDINKYFL